ncbi:MAG: ABC transporter substrate-binding protein [Lachnospiraceae bacterium]|nr:ABC transporter substrate-binding protein [Lachnospiraceae bacterium]
MKRKTIKKLLLVLVLTTLTIALSACSGDKEGENSDSSSITIGIPQDVEDSLDPHKAVAAGTEEVFFNIYEGLVKPDSDGNLVPAVASDYAISEDGMTYTFTLRDGIKFHDGNLVTVDDIKYSLDRCADTSNGDPLVSAFSNIDSVNVIDEKTVEVVLKEADTEFLFYLTNAIIPASNEDPAKNAIGTGPYRFVSHAPQESFVMKKFDGYWGTPAHIDNVTLKVCANVDSIAMDLNGGAIDMFARVPTEQAAQLSDNFEVQEGTMNLVQALYLNNSVEPFTDPKVRQALCYALDKQNIMDIVADGKGTPVGSSMFPAFGKYYMEELNDVYTTDYEKAKELLTEAGYPDGFSFTMTVPSNYTQHVNTAQVLVEQFKNIGVDAQINLVEWDAWLSDVYTDRNYEATVVGVDASSMTGRAMLERFTSTAPNNFVNYSNPTYDETFAKAIAATDDAEKTKYYKECERILAEDAANVYIQDLSCLVAVNKKYAGYEFYPLYVQDFSKLYLVEEKQ